MGKHKACEQPEHRDPRTDLDGTGTTSVTPAFWGYAKTRLARFRGIHPYAFVNHLKECEFRFNHRRHDLYKVLLALCRNNPLS